ncbi:MAG: hypothetical protein ACR2GS_02495 [Thermomicrobiales bacterium]
MDRSTLFRPESWPAGHRAALVVILDLNPIEHQVTPRTRFAAQSGLDHLLAMFADLEIVPSLILDSDIKELVTIPADAEYDPAIFALDDDDVIPELVRDCERDFGRAPRGIVFPHGNNDALAQIPHGAWVLDLSEAPLPIFNQYGGTTIHYSPWWHDTAWLPPEFPSPPSALLEHWSASLASVRARGDMMTITLSVPLSGHPAHLETIQRFLDEAIAAGDVWITNGSAVHALVARDSKQQ